jgi:hypothetical protein
MGDTLSPQLRVALTPLLSALETITARIREYDAQIEKLAEKSYPEVALLSECQDERVVYRSRRGTRTSGELGRGLRFSRSPLLRGLCWSRGPFGVILLCAGRQANRTTRGF